MNTTLEIQNLMGNTFYIFAVVLVDFWAIGHLACGLGAMIHLLLGLAVISFSIKFFSKKNRAEPQSIKSLTSNHLASKEEFIMNTLEAKKKQ